MELNNINTNEDFMGLNFTCFFNRMMTLLFAPPIKKNETTTWIDDILIQADTKTQMFDGLRNFLETLRKFKHKAAPDKRYFFLATSEFLGHVIIENKIKPLPNKFEAIQQLKRPEFKKDVMKVLGAL